MIVNSSSVSLFLKYTSCGFSIALKDTRYVKGAWSEWICKPEPFPSTLVYTRTKRFVGLRLGSRKAGKIASTSGLSADE